MVQADQIDNIDLTGLHILLIEDEPAGLNIYKMMLELYGADVSESESGEQGLALLTQYAQTDPIDVVLLDIILRCPAQSMAWNLPVESVKLRITGCVARLFLRSPPSARPEIGNGF
jgi:CheY-like chemotaxis protein